MRTPRWFIASVVFASIIQPGTAQAAKPDTLVTVPQAVDAWISNTETHVVQIADSMPGDNYSFAPAHGEFKGVRTFGQQLKHLAAGNYYAAAIILGDPIPEGAMGEVGPESVKTKAEIVAYVKGSFEYLHRAAATLDVPRAAPPIPGVTGVWQRSRVGWAIDAIAHSWDHYGQMVEYVRMKGIIPPR